MAMRVKAQAATPIAFPATVIAWGAALSLRDPGPGGTFLRKSSCPVRPSERAAMRASWWSRRGTPSTWTSR